uniref:Transmembrane and coiled-coil domain family 1 n=1 Tax=Latimeria chalumnae TaxID=7897 RepID=H3AVC6_LATCH
QQIERLEVSSLAQSSSAVASSADGSINVDSVDGTPDPQRTKVVITHLQQKILKLTEQIKIEQTARDNNVAEYLELANNADKQQSTRIKQLFLKKNFILVSHVDPAMAAVMHTQTRTPKLDLQTCNRNPREVLKELFKGTVCVCARLFVWGDGGLSPALKKKQKKTEKNSGPYTPLPFKLNKIKQTAVSKTESVALYDDSYPHLCTIPAAPVKLGPGLTCKLQRQLQLLAPGQGNANRVSGWGGGGASTLTDVYDSFCLGFFPFSSVTGFGHMVAVSARVCVFCFFSSEHTSISCSGSLNFSVSNPFYPCERLEEQLNDLTELHQNEILNLKQELASMEEKIAYQSYERARDIQEALEACQTRISKMELQQQQQQVVQLEGLENATARTLLGKLINVLLAIMAVVLVFVSTVANCVVPLMKTRNRTFSTFFLVVVIAFLWKNWEAITNYLERFMLPPR